MGIITTVLFICLCNLAVVLSADKTDKPAKDCDDKRFDEHSANAFAQFGLEELEWPENSQQLSRYCRKTKTSTEFSKQYGENCLKGTSQTLMSLAVYNFDVVNKQYCSKKGKLKEQFPQWGKCGNDAKKDTKKCWDKMMNPMANIMKVTEAKSRLPIICCTYYEWIACNDKALAKHGDDCSEEARKGFSTHIHKSTVDSMNLICSKYDNEPSKCKPFMEKAIRSKPKGRTHKAPLLYVFEVFDNL